MELGRKPWAMPSMVTQVTRKKSVLPIFLVALSLIVLITFSVFAKLVTVEADGKQVKYLTVRGTVGDFLNHTKLGVFPEDLVLPDRDSTIKRGMHISLQRSIPIDITLDGKTIPFRTLASQVGQALEDGENKLGFRLKDTDEVEPGRDTVIKSGLKVTVYRSVPITIVADGTSRNVEMAPRLVKDILSKQQIALGPLDLVTPDPDQMIAANSTIKVVRVTEKTLTLKSSLPFQVVTKAGNFPVGLPDRIVSKGSLGLEQQTVKVTYEDGKEVNRTILEQKTLRKPVEQVVARGSQTSVSRGGQTIKFKRAYLVRATGYYAPGGRTSLGIPVERGVVAVDPRVIPYRSSLWVEGYGWGKALDTGGAIKGNRIDLYFESLNEALSWGVRNVTIYVQ